MGEFKPGNKTIYADLCAESEKIELLNSFINIQHVKKSAPRTIREKGLIVVVGHNSEPCGNFGTILRHKLPVIHPDLPRSTTDLNSSAQSQFLNPTFLHKTDNIWRVLWGFWKVMLRVLEGNFRVC